MYRLSWCSRYDEIIAPLLRIGCRECLQSIIIQTFPMQNRWYSAYEWMHKDLWKSSAIIYFYASIYIAYKVQVLPVLQPWYISYQHRSNWMFTRQIYPTSRESIAAIKPSLLATPSYLRCPKQASVLQLQKQVNDKEYRTAGWSHDTTTLSRMQSAAAAVTSRHVVSQLVITIFRVANAMTIMLLDEGKDLTVNQRMI